MSDTSDQELVESVEPLYANRAAIFELLRGNIVSYGTKSIVLILHRGNGRNIVPRYFVVGLEIRDRAHVATHNMCIFKILRIFRRGVTPQLGLYMAMKILFMYAIRTAYIIL